MKRFAKVVAIVAAATMLLAVALASCCHANLDDCHDATCRISASGALGTGACFEVSQGYVFVLTNAHVVGNSSAVYCEFWTQGHQSSKLAGAVIKRNAVVDAAVIAIPAASFGGRLPTAIPLAPRGTVLQPGETVLSVGCPHGQWASGWKGHVLGYSGGDLHFVPTPANGRSGSAVFDATGQRIIALLRARTIDERQGIAVSITNLYSVFGRPTKTVTQSASEQTLTAWRASGLPTPPAGYGWKRTIHGEYALEPSSCPDGRCPILPWNRQPQQQQPQPQTPYPTLPQPQTPAPVPESLDLEPITQRLDGIQGQLDKIIGNTTAPETPPLVPEISPALNDIAIGLSDRIDELGEKTKTDIAEVRSIAETNQENVGKLTTLVEGVSANQSKLVDAVAEDGTLSQRFHARVEKVKEELGADASARDVRIGYLKDMLAEKALHPISSLWTGVATGSPIAIGLIILGAFLVMKDRRDRMATGDPLIIEKIAKLTPWGVDDVLAKKIADRLAPYTAPAPQAPAAAAAAPAAAAK